MKKIKLAEALLRRKELQEKVDRLRTVRDSDMCVLKVRRVSASEGIDEITASVPQVSVSQVTQAFDFNARQLRRVDAAIQQANWNTEVELADDALVDFLETELIDDRRMG